MSFAQFAWKYNPAKVISKTRFESSNDETNGVNVTSLKDQKFYYLFFLNIGVIILSF